MKRVSSISACYYCNRMAGDPQFETELEHARIDLDQPGPAVVVEGQWSTPYPVVVVVVLVLVAVAVAVVRTDYRMDVLVKCGVGGCRAHTRSSVMQHAMPIPSPSQADIQGENDMKRSPK